MATSGYSVEALVKLTTQADNIDPAKRDDTVRYIASHLNRSVGYHQSRHTGPLWRSYGIYLYVLYVITKLLYTAVPIFLLYALNAMMGEGYWNYGLRAAFGIFKGVEYIENPMFPTVTFCDFRVRRLGGNIHRYTVQCVLTVNLFNERIFLVIWWWLLILAVMSAVGLLVFLVKSLWPNSNFDFVMKSLHLLGAASRAKPHDRELVTRFTGDFLRPDGLFCLRLVTQNVPDVIAAEIITALYQKWKVDQKEAETAETTPWLKRPQDNLPDSGEQPPDDSIPKGRANYYKATFDD